MKRLIFLLIILLSSCAKDIVDLSCTISGTVKDKDNNQLIENCLVTLSNGLTRTTSAAGTFEFKDLEAGNYTLTFSKTGYTDASQSISLTAGKEENIAVLLKCKDPLASSTSVLNFGDFESSKSFVLSNNSDGAITYEILNKPAWVQLSQLKGTISIAGYESIDVIVDRNQLNFGDHSQILTINYSGRKSGTLTIEIICNKVELTIPTVSIYSQAENIKQNEFTIQGDIVKTGGSEIISYGHCWSTSPNPNISNEKSDFGKTSKVGNFSTHITGLNVFTTYYVRAYATNAQGTAYSEEIVVTTQDVASNKWDGNLENSFAGGSGTKTDPYLIATGGQLLHIKDDNGKYYKLIGNIDLDNKNWLPIELKGNFDGNGFIISNLRISRQNDNLGLFSKISGECSLSNLTIQGVDIQAPKQSNIGAFAGISQGSIQSCTLKMLANSKMIGNENVGAVVGNLEFAETMYISNCIVNANESCTIIGNKNVGGIVGRNSNAVRLVISNCHSSVSLEVGSNGGGIIAYIAYPYEISNCSFIGSINGDYKLGGIIGEPSSNYTEYDKYKIIACKSIVHIKGIDNMGGIIGGIVGPSYDPGCSIIACYSDGTIESANKASFIGGISGGCKGCYYPISYCYSTITCKSTCFHGIDPVLSKVYIQDCVYVNETDDIINYFKELYSSEINNNYNLNNSWTWSGTVNGKQKTVLCPKLKWEQ